ncbi:hypothetical protein ACP70R_022485 [Stipagrostis hirtigluma subsp. patula]
MASSTMLPATPPPPPAPTMTTTMPVPGYQVSGAGAGAAAAPRHVAGYGGGSVGAFFGVLAAVLVLAVLSCVFGRVCAAQAAGPDERYDCTRLARRRCWQRRAPRRPAPAAEEKQQVAPPLPLPEP